MTWTTGMMRTSAPTPLSPRKTKKTTLLSRRPALHNPRPPAAPLDDEGRSPLASSLSSSDMLDVCKHTAVRLDVPWPAAVAETTRSRYEEKRLPLARNMAKQPLPVFLELLEEMACSWGDRPYSSRSPISGASLFNCEAMDNREMLHISHMEPLVAAQLHPRLLMLSSRTPTLPSGLDRFQPALTERTYRATALNIRALNVLSLKHCLPVRAVRRLEPPAKPWAPR